MIKILWPCFYYRRQQEATSVSARQDSWVGTVRFRETAVAAVRVGTAAAVTRCWTASFVTVRRASPVQPVRWGLDQVGKRAVKKHLFVREHIFIFSFTLSRCRMTHAAPTHATIRLSATTWREISTAAALMIMKAKPVQSSRTTARPTTVKVTLDKSNTSLT